MVIRLCSNAPNSQSSRHSQAFKMVYGLKVEDGLEGASNFTSWKFKILVIEENDLLEFVQGKDHLNLKGKMNYSSSRRMLSKPTIS